MSNNRDLAMFSLNDVIHTLKECERDEIQYGHAFEPMLMFASVLTGLSEAFLVDMMQLRGDVDLTFIEKQIDPFVVVRGVVGSSLRLEYVDDAFVDVFLSEDGEMFCWVSDDDEGARRVRSHIEDVKEGDAFFAGGNGFIWIAGEDAHQNFDEPDAPWVVYDLDGEGWFKEDFNTESFSMVKGFLEEFVQQEKTLAAKVADAYSQSDFEVGRGCGAEKIME